MTFVDRKNNNSSSSEKESDCMNKRIVGQTIATTEDRAKQLAKLKPDATVTIEKWKEWYIVTFFKES